MEQGAHIRRTMQTIAAKPSSSIPEWQPASLFHNLTPHSATQYERVSSANRLVSHFDCALHNRRNVHAARTHLDTTSPNRKPRSQIAAKRDQTCDTTCPHSVCSNTLIVTRVTCAPNVTGASWQGIPCHDGPSARAHGPLLIGNIPTDGATPLRTAAKL